MDKLEKALQKARQQRKIEMEAQAARQHKAAAETEAGRAAQPIITSNLITFEAPELEEHHIIAQRTRNQEADIFRILRTKVLQIMTQHGYRTLGITSPNYGDGKTTIALNLAVSIALDQKQTVLLADLDLRKPNVTEYLGIRAPFGISDYFHDDVPISTCLLRTSFDRLSILPAGRPVDNSSEVLGSPKVSALADELRSRYPDRFIIYDMPPTLAQDDPITFLPHVDAILLVVNDGNTRINELKLSLHVLTTANVIGTVLNTSDEKKKNGRLGRLVEFMDKSFNTTHPASAE